MSNTLHPRPHPPSLRRLAVSPALRALTTARTVWRARRNLLHIVHPDVADLPWCETRMGAQRLVTVNDAGLARHVLRDAEACFVKGPLYRALLSDVVGESSLLLEGEAARARRRLLGPAFNARAMARVEGVVRAHVEATVRGWTRAPGVVDLTADCPRMAMRIALEAFFGADLGARVERIAAILDEMLAEASTPSLADLLGLPAWAPRRSRRRVRAAVREVETILYGVIDARRANPADEPTDLLDALLGAVDPETGARLSRRAVRDEVMTLFLAGHETTALSMAWGLDRLSREPAAQARIAADPALAGPAYEEALRLYPPAWIVARECAAPTRWDDLSLRAGDRVQIPIFVLHRNRRYWRDPDAFDLDRFAAGAPPAFMPFGLGPRICVGMALARLEGRMLLAAALSRLTLTPAGAPPEPVGRVTLRSAAPIRVRVAPRVSPPRPPAA